jgi:hypothetical protein
MRSMYYTGNLCSELGIDVRRSTSCAGDLLPSLAIHLSVSSSIQVLLNQLDI